jgi:hypothetical protein
MTIARLLFGAVFLTTLRPHKALFLTNHSVYVTSNEINDELAKVRR